MKLPAKRVSAFCQTRLSQDLDAIRTVIGHGLDTVRTGGRA
jgi:hypothetical protein